MSSEASVTNTEAAILARVVQTHSQKLAPEVARYLLSIELTPDDVERVNELSEKAQAGVLTIEERSELNSYLHVGNLLAVIQSKARQSSNRA